MLSELRVVVAFETDEKHWFVTHEENFHNVSHLFAWFISS